MGNILNLRPSRAEDEPFLRSLRGAVDSERLFMNYWNGGSEEEKVKILDLQFRAQAAHHRMLKNVCETKENIIEMDGIPVGRFVVSGGREELRLVEIALVKEWRGKGIGKLVISSTMQECERTGRVLRLCVEKTNIMALKLYLSLGFYAIEDLGGHLMLEWNVRGPTGGKLFSFGAQK
jgi:ribosomal protein S18 acetylase RimI-like enzyme